MLFAPREYAFFQRLARKAGMSLGEWVRQSLRQVATRLNVPAPEERLKAVRELSRLSLPVSGIDDLLLEMHVARSRDINQGLGDDAP